jgi:hypothetical protein
LPNHVKALIDVLSGRTGGFLLFNLLYGVVFAAHFAHFWRFSLTQNDTPHFSLMLLGLYRIWCGNRPWDVLHPL